MNIGTAKSEFPRNYGVPMRGWDPQNPSTLTISLPLASNLAGDIWEGQIISMNADGSAWELGVNATTYASKKPGVVAFAQNSTKSTDVISANNLVGLSCSGKFRVATPFFCRTVTETLGSETKTAYSVASYAPGTLVTYCKNDEFDFVSEANGAEVVTAKRSAAGFIRPAKANEPVIGVVVGSIPDIPAAAIGALNYDAAQVPSAERPADGTALTENTTKYYMPNTGVVALAHTWEDTIDSSAKLNNSYYVVIDTTFAPQA